MARIMVVDDSDHFREGVVIALQSEGHEITELTDGRDVKKLLEHRVFDLIIMDIVMPEKGGVETMIDLNGNLGKTRVILMTGKVSKDSAVLANITRHFGGYRILFKPFKKSELLNLVNDLL